MSKSVTPGTKVMADRATVTILLAEYRRAKDTEKAAKDAAEDARDALLRIAGDNEIITDENGLMLCKLPERERRTLPVEPALAAHPDLVDLVNTAHYRVVTK